MRVQHVTKQAYTRLPLPRCTNIIVLQDVLQLCLYTTVTAVDRHPHLEYILVKRFFTPAVSSPAFSSSLSRILTPHIYSLKQVLSS